jgi:hypothetical protein
MADESAFEGWAILELMGHRRLAGYVQEATIAGGAFIRLDVPGDACAACGHPESSHTTGGMCAGEPPDGSECHCVMMAPLVDTVPLATQFYSPAAVYCITPTSEDTARKIAKRTKPQPAHRWELEPAPVYAGDPEKQEDDDYRRTLDDDGLPF